MSQKEFKLGEKAIHKLTGEEILILEVGPRSDTVTQMTPHGPALVNQEYLKEGMAHVRLKNMTAVKIFFYEVEGVECHEDSKSPLRLVDK